MGEDMKKRNEPAFPTHVTGPHGGLSKYEHTVIEMAAAMIAGSYTSAYDALSDEVVTKRSRELATALWDELEKSE